MADFWKKSVVYQIYPKSFKDSNNDGIGDLRGIIEKLDYLQELGVDIIWLNPVYASPQADNGYDISDYFSIYPPFGTLDDMKQLLQESHRRGIKVMMDLVVNHTSDEHIWFKESRKSRNNPYRDFYIWRDARGYDDNRKPIPPNNWGSFFSGSAWEWDENTEQFYLHLFSKNQPDLNWENDLVRRKIYDMMNWWMQMGVDGWRIDTCNLYSKHTAFLDFPSRDGEKYVISPMYARGPRIHEFLREMNREVFSRYDCVTVGEAPFTTAEEAILYTAPEEHKLNMIFTFEHMEIDSAPGSMNGKWDIAKPNLPRLKKVFEKWQKTLYKKGWNSLYWNNHDQPRIVSRWGDDGQYRVKSAKMLACILHLMQGTPFIYQGEEIGMTNCRYNLEDYNDIEIHNAYREIVQEQKTMTHDEFMEAVHKKGRDNARTPFQWDDSENAGFSSARPWLKVNPRYKEINAEKDRKSPDSIYYWYQKLIRLRKEMEIITEGDFNLLFPDDEDIFAYMRTFEDERLIVVGNFSGKTREIELDGQLDGYEILLKNYDERLSISNRITVKPWEVFALYRGAKIA